MREMKINKELEKVLDEQFPKGECKERGHALVLFARAQMEIDKYENKMREIKYKIKEIINEFEMGEKK